jgi:hypothetical protein
VGGKGEIENRGAERACDCRGRNLRALAERSFRLRGPLLCFAGIRCSDAAAAVGRKTAMATAGRE